MVDGFDFLFLPQIANFYFYPLIEFYKASPCITLQNHSHHCIPTYLLVFFFLNFNDVVVLSTVIVKLYSHHLPAARMALWPSG
jgi:hypothetical protein